jgi:large repetitive protein
MLLALALASSNSTASSAAPVAAPTSVSYSGVKSYWIQSADVNYSPTTAGGVPTSYTIAPSLPSGLALNSTTGAITGKPTTQTDKTTYTITATNSGGSVNTTISFVVPPSVVTTEPVDITVNGAETAGTLSASGNNFYALDVTKTGKTNFAAYSVANTLDVRVRVYNRLGVQQGATTDSGVAGIIEESRVTYNTAGLYYYNVGSVSGSGTYYVKVINEDIATPLTGNGKCSGFTSGVFVGHCIDFASDYRGGSATASARCTNLGGTHSTGACSTTNRVGRCTWVLYEGYSTVVFYSTAPANNTTASSQTACGGDIFHSN